MGSMRLICSVFILISLSYQTSAARAVTSAVDALKFLQRYGYAPKHYDARLLNDEEAFSGYLRKMQRFAGIEATGELDSETIRMMNSPRCGMADTKQSYNLDDRQPYDQDDRQPYDQDDRQPYDLDIFSSKRFDFSGAKWAKNDLTYGFKVYSKKFSNKTQRDVIKRALDTWAKVTPLKFTETNWAIADIKVQFVSKVHDDSASFDGPLGVLAHAYFPTSGKLCFDDDEKFTDKSFAGVNLYQVAVHEIGHILGLGHSEDKRAVMQPYYSPYDPNFKLHADDIAGIQDAYGKPSSTYSFE